MLLTVFLLGCSPAEKAVVVLDYDSTLLFEVGHADTSQGAYDNTGDIHVAAHCSVPVPRRGGPGRVLAFDNGLLVELKWSKVEPITDSEERGVVFSEFQWHIGNRLLQGKYDSRTFGWHRERGPSTTRFTEDYRLLVSTTSINPGRDTQGEAPFLMVRARWHSVKLNPPDIQLLESQDETHE
jgi:hypothetical protein